MAKPYFVKRQTRTQHTILIKRGLQGFTPLILYLTQRLSNVTCPLVRNVHVKSLYLQADLRHIIFVQLK